MIRRAGKLGLTHCYRPIAILIETCDELPQANAPGSRNDAELARRIPTPFVMDQQFFRYTSPHERGRPSQPRRIHRGTARDRRRPQKHHSPRKVLWIELKEAIDHEAPQTVPHEMQSGWRKLAHESGQPRGNLRHRSGHRGITKRMHPEAKLALQPATQQ